MRNSKNTIFLTLAMGSIFIFGALTAVSAAEDGGGSAFDWQTLANLADAGTETTDTNDASEADTADTDVIKDYRDYLSGMDKIISLELRNMDVNDALKYLAVRGDLNIVTSRKVTGRVSFQLKDVPIRDVFDMTLLSNELAYEKRGDIYYIMSDKEYEARFGKKFDDAREVKVFRLNYAIPEKAFDLLDTLKSKVGRILVDQESGTVLIMDTSENLRAMEDALAVLERKSSVGVFELQYANAREIEDQLTPQLDAKKVGTVTADERNNQVIVQTLPDRMKDIEKMIAALDRKTSEVLIDVKIVKVVLSDDFSYGVDWEGLFQRTDDAIQFVSSHPYDALYRTGESYVNQFFSSYNDLDTASLKFDDRPKAGSKEEFPGKVTFGIAGKVEAVVEYLQTLGDTKLLSNPKLAVVNNQEARIHVGKREVYITTTTTSGQTTVTSAEEVTFVDTGIQLSVTPTINKDGYVTMKIKPEISSVVDELITPSGNKIPIIDTSLVETTLMVKDDSTVVIGGLRREAEVSVDKRVPILGSIPIFGGLFSRQTSETEQEELIVMITPLIIEGDSIVTGEQGFGRDPLKAPAEYETVEPIGEYGHLRLKPYLD